MFNSGESGDIFPQYFSYAEVFQEIILTVFSERK